jgi:hypothetical protein
MNSRPFYDLPCAICSQPVNLQMDMSADENGKAVHSECYVKRITAHKAILRPLVPPT